MENEKKNEYSIYPEKYVKNIAVVVDFLLANRKTYTLSSNVSYHVYRGRIYEE